MTSPSLLPTDEDALDLDELERIARAATPGPWLVGNSPMFGPSAITRDAEGLRQVQDSWICDADAGHPNAAHIAAFSPSTVLALIAAARRSVVSTPSDEVRALIAESREVDGYESSIILNGLVDRLADALEASAVSAPPTITDEMVERAAQKFYAATVRSYAYAPWALAEQEPFLKVARAALRAALGGEA